MTRCNALAPAVRTYPALTTADPAELDLRGPAAGVQLGTERGHVTKRLLVEYG